MSDQALLGIMGLLGIMVTTAGGVVIANRKSKSDSKSSGFTQSFEMTKYIRAEIAKEVGIQTKPLREKIRALEKVVGSLYDLRDAFREFYREAKEALEKLGGSTPHVEERIRVLLDESDADTVTNRMVAEIRASNESGTED